MKKITIFTLTTLLLLFNCNDSNNGSNDYNSGVHVPPIDCEDGVCLEDAQLTFFSRHISSITTKQELYEATELYLSSQSIDNIPAGIFSNLHNLTDLNLSNNQLTTLPTGIFNNLTNLTELDLTDNPICSVDKGDVGLADTVIVNLTPIDARCITDAQLTFFRQDSNITTKQKLYEATELYLSSKDITSLEAGIFNNLINLTSVDLTDNTICVDKADVGLTDSVTLTFDGWNCLTDDQLTFFKMHITDITTKQELYEATELYLSSQSIDNIPAGIFNNLTNLTDLNLSNNQLTTLPAGIFNNLTNLTELDLTDNPICSVDKGDVGLADGVNLNFEIGQCLTQKQLNFFKMHLEDNTLKKQELYEKTSLDLSIKSITSLEAGIFNNLTNLTFLCLNNNQLTSLPDSLPAGIFTKLTSLTSLWLHNNQLTSIPTEIGNLTNLTDLRLNNNQLTSIPAEIGNLTSLTQLDLSSNKLNSIPAGLFTNLTNLTTLSLYDNQLTSIPAEIGNLTKLTDLRLIYNQLTSLPAGIFDNLDNLTRLWLKFYPDTNTFTCNRDEYDTWGLPAQTLLPTVFTCVCKDEDCLTQKQLNFFSGYIPSLDTKQKLFEETFLDLRNKSISTLPTGIFNNLTSLTSVDLTGNYTCIVDTADVGLTDRVNLTLPPLDARCITNEQLDFFSGHITSIFFHTNCIICIRTKQELFEARTLDLRNKSISTLPTGIFNNLTNLTTLNLRSNDLTSIPDGIFNNLTKLTSVDLRGNYTCIVDKADVGLDNGVTLTLPPLNEDCLTDAQLTFFNGHINSITTKQELFEARTLDLSNKSISTLPTGIFNNLTNLTTLNLRSNDLTSIPAGIFDNLTSLTTLNLRSNDLTSIPDGIFNNLTSLTDLNLSFNALTSIPAEIGNLTSLTTLGLNSNDLTDIPTEIFNLTSLTHLYLHHNQLTDIPAEIGNLTSLTTLGLNNNQLTSIPTEIGNLTSLTKLSFYGNKLASLPDGIFTGLTNLTILQLKNSGLIEMNSFDCTRANYTTWGLPDPIPSTLTTLFCV